MEKNEKDPAAEDWVYYSRILKGLKPDMPDSFLLLAELLGQGQFELTGQKAADRQTKETGGALAVSCGADNEKKKAGGMFPPLGYHFYPAVPVKYIAERENSMDLAEEAADLMEELALRVGDRSLLRVLRRYRKQPSVRRAGAAAAMLAEKKHLPIVLELEREIREAASVHPKREYPAESAAEFRNRIARAEEEVQRLEAQGRRAAIHIEEPFTESADSIVFHVYVLEYIPGFRKVRCRIREF